MVRPWAALVAVTAAASLAGWWLGGARRDAGPGPGRVTAVIDGDTIEVTWAAPPRAEVVRLLGVDTPESVHPQRPVECFGPEASAFTKERLLGRAVRLELDREARDRYGRLLAYVEVPGGGRFNDELLRAGYARLLVIPPNGAHGRQMLDHELDARAAGRGLWGAC